jgi:XTP/dITP diphosphohydrolase
MDLLIATQNKGKLREYQGMLAGLPVNVLTPADVGLNSFDVEETADTYVGNAELKARAFAGASHRIALADDSGVDVDALDGRPGVFSARYAPTPAARIEKLLGELDGVPDAERTARFVCVVALVQPGVDEVITAVGSVEGRIAAEVCDGEHGFGYDPIFIPDGYAVCMADLPPDVKNRLSHRGRALHNLLPQLRAIIQKN